MNKKSQQNFFSNVSIIPAPKHLQYQVTPLSNSEPLSFSLQLPFTPSHSPSVSVSLYNLLSLLRSRSLAPPFSRINYHSTSIAHSDLFSSIQGILLTSHSFVVLFGDLLDLQDLSTYPVSIQRFHHHEMRNFENL
jgi:hypothetical protein